MKKYKFRFGEYLHTFLWAGAAYICLKAAHVDEFLIGYILGTITAVGFNLTDAVLDIRS